MKAEILKRRFDGTIPLHSLQVLFGKRLEQRSGDGTKVRIGLRGLTCPVNSYRCTASGLSSPTDHSSNGEREARGSGRHCHGRGKKNVPRLSVAVLIPCVSSDRSCSGLAPASALRTESNACLSCWSNSLTRCSILHFSSSRAAKAACEKNGIYSWGVRTEGFNIQRVVDRMPYTGLFGLASTPGWPRGKHILADV